MAVEGMIESHDGARIHYEHHDNGKPLLLFLHGFSMDKHSWKNQTDFFKDDYSILAYDMRGHGKSDAPKKKEAYCLENFVNDVNSVTDNVVPDENFSLIGFSLGGSIGLKYAEKYPAKLNNIVVINPVYGLSWIRETYFKQLSLAMRTPRFLIKAGLDDEPIWNYKGKLNTYRKAFLSTEKHVIKNVVDMLKEHEQSKFLINVNNKIIHSKNDEIVRPEPPLAFSNVSFIEGGHHFVIAQKPDDVNRLISDFLDRAE